jgi:hypothetical protein
MPTVRRYGEQQVSIAPLPGARRTAAATAESEGAGLAQAKGRGAAMVGAAIENATTPLQRLGEAAYAKLQQDERDSADEVALLKASNQLADWKTKTLYDPDSGALTKRGEAAFPLPDQVRDGFKKASGDIAAGLHTDRQRLAFAKMQSQEWQSLDLTVQRHVAGEMADFRGKELNGLVANTTDEAIRNAEDPRLVALNVDKAETAIRTNAPKLGLGAEAVEQQVRAMKSGVHLGVINNLLALEQDGKASAYFEAAKDEIAGDKLDAVQKALEAGTLRKQGQQQADTILRAGGTLAEQREKARAIDNPKLRDEVMQRIEHEDAVKEREKREAYDTTLRQAFDIIDQTHDVTKIPAPTWASMDPAHRSAARSYARTLAKGEPIETDLPTYYSLMQQAADDPGMFTSQNLLNYRHKLDEPEFKQLSSLQLSIKNGNRNASEKELAGFRTKNDIIEDTLSQYGIDPKAKPDTAEGKAIAQLRRMLDRRVDAAQLDGKKVSNVELQQTLDDLLGQQTTVPGSWWNFWPGGQPFFDSTKRLIDSDVSDITPTDRQVYERVLRDAGRPVTDATVLDLHLETMLRRTRRQGR